MSIWVFVKKTHSPPSHEHLRLQHLKHFVENDPKHQIWHTLISILNTKQDQDQGAQCTTSIHNLYESYNPISNYIVLKTFCYIWVWVIFRLTGFCLRSPCSYSARERKLSVATQRGSCTRGAIIGFSQVIVTIVVVDALTLFPFPCTITSQSVQLLLTQLLQSLRGFGRQVWLDTRARDNQRIDEKRHFRGPLTRRW